MSINEMVAVLQHYENGGEVEFTPSGTKLWRSTNHIKPRWDFDKYEYRIKEKPKTKTVYEWMVLTQCIGWSLFDAITTEEEMKNQDTYKVYQKTGRQWEVPND